MTVVEAYIGGKKIEPPDNESVLPPLVKPLIMEGVAQNTTGSVFVPEVSERNMHQGCFIRAYSHYGLRRH